METSVTHIRVSFGDDDAARIVIPIPTRCYRALHSLGREPRVKLPDGEVLDLQASASFETRPADAAVHHRGRAPAGDSLWRRSLGELHDGRRIGNPDPRPKSSASRRRHWN